MNAETAFAGIKPFNAFAAYEREREHSRKIEAQLLRAMMLLRLAVDRGKVVDPEAVNTFLRECAQ